MAPALLTLLLAQAPWLPWLFLVALSLAAAPAVLELERLTRPGQPVDPAVRQEPAAQSV